VYVFRSPPSNRKGLPGPLWPKIVPATTGRRAKITQATAPIALPIRTVVQRLFSL